jgi:oxidoreductase AflX
MMHIRCVFQNNDPLPRIIVLSSGTISDHLTRETPKVARNIVWCGFSNVYKDLIKAESYYRMQKSWMTAIFVLPGALSYDVQSGHAIDTEKEAAGFLSYLDLAAGMIECGSKSRDDKEYDWVSLSVVPTGKTKIYWKAPFNVLRGCVWTIFPPLYWAFHYAGVV